MDWIDPKDLQHWADLPECETTLPALVRRLVGATIPTASFVDIPSGSSVTLGGWDGVVSVSTGNAFVPGGVSAWEMSRRTDIRKKADEDYEKRTQAPRALIPAETTFIFVTPRPWGEKRDWESSRKAEGIWKDVRVYDASNLAQWIEQAPAVGAWLARQLRKVPPTGILAADEFWEDWSSVTKPEITPALVLAGRGEHAKLLAEWIAGPADQFFIQGETKDEAVAFACAAALALADSGGLSFFSRALIVRSADAWRSVCQHPTALILIMDLPDVSPAVAVRGGHHVVVPIGHGDKGVGRGCVLPRLGRDEIITALAGMGFTDDVARQLARATARSMPVLRRRLIGRAGGQKPAWASPPSAGALLPALLAGQWSETEGDQQVVTMLAGRPYAELVSDYSLLLNQPDAPLRKIGHHWRLTSPEEAWELLAPALTQQHLERLRDAAVAGLSELSPEYDLPDDERHMAALRGKILRHSGALREGLANTLALMGSRPERAENAGDAQLITNDAVRRILGEPGKWQTWASVGSLLPTLAEAAPEVVLDRIEEGLSQTPNPFEALLKDQGNGLWGACLHAGLLWALERVAWSPEYFSRAAFILARLAAIDPGGRWANRPRESLRALFLPWIRCSAMPDGRRLQVLDELLNRLPDAGWNCLVAAGPQSHDSLMQRTPPEWRGWAQDATIAPTIAERQAISTELVSRIIRFVGEDPRRWRDLMEVIANLSPAQQNEAITKLEATVARLREKSGAIELWCKIREVVGHHRDFPGSNWAMPRVAVDRLAAIYESLRPTDAFVASEWLFDSWPRLLDGDHNQDYQARARKVEGLQADALRSIIAEHGKEGAIKLARRVSAPWSVGRAAVSAIAGRDEIIELVTPYLDHEENTLRAFERAACEALFQRDGWTALEAFLAAAKNGPEATEKCAEIYLAAPTTMETWRRLENEPEEVQSVYWSTLGNRMFLVPKGSPEFVYGLERLLNADRPLAVIHALASSTTVVPTDLVIRALEATSRALNDAALRKRSAVISGYELGKVFERLDSNDVPQQLIARLEIPFVGILEHYRPNLAAHREVAENATTFADLVTWAYKRNDGKVDDEALAEDQRANRARLAWRVLGQTRRLPGQLDDGSIDQKTLQSWIVEARRVCAERARGEVADVVIGEILASAPADASGIWPCEPVRKILDEINSQAMGRGFRIGKSNLRGVTSRGVFDGGAQERELAAEFRRSADAVTARFPFTGKLLRSLAGSYEEEARSEDKDADWRDR